MPQKSIISLDSGSSFMKAYDGTNKNSFPAIVRRLPDNQVDGKEIKINGDYYLVGHAAASSMNTVILTPHIQPGFHGSTEQYVQICYALSRLKINGEMDTLVCSLPYTDSRNREIKAALRERKVFEWSLVHPEDDSDIGRKVTFKDVRIIPQGVGAIDIASKKPTGHAETIMLVDIGSCTTDVVTVAVNSEENTYEYCRDACRSIENANVTWFKERWLSIVRNEVRDFDPDHGYSRDYFALMQHAIVNDFNMQYYDRVINIEPHFQAAKNEFSHKMLPLLREVAGTRWDAITKIIMTGGGTNLINFDLLADKRLEKLDQWANVMGQYTMALQMAEAASEKPEAHKAAEVA